MAFRKSALLAGAAVVATAGVAWSQTLTIGVSLETPSIDPYFYAFTNSYQVAHQIFDPLVRQDANQRQIPALAESWRNVDEKTWEFKLRRGVKWHDGSPFTADDVLYSVERARAGIPGSPTTPSRNFLQGDKQYQKIDDYTVHVITPSAYSQMVFDYTEPVILSRKHGANAQTEDYNAGKATIGTGPYKFKEFVKGDRVVLDANADYWGGKEPWSQVVMKPIPSAPARIAALLSGAVDVIDSVPAEDLPNLRSNSRVTVHLAASNLVLRIMFDYGRMQHDWVKANDGATLFPNPLKDWRVRKAISHAIDRQALVERVMGGAATAAGQAQPPGSMAHDPDLKPDAHDPDLARRLLAEAGFRDGFRLTMHTPGNRWPGDRQISEAIVQMLARIGIKAELEVVPPNIYPTRANNGEFAFYLGAWGTPSGDGGNFLLNGLHSFQPADRRGAANWGRYNNRDLDETIGKSLTALDPAKREELIRDAYRLVVRDYGNVFVLWGAHAWASKPDLVVEPRRDGFTMATAVRKK